MKKSVILAIILLVASAAFIWSYLRPVHIKEAAANPAAYKRRITLIGITSAFSPQDRTIFGLTDTRELEGSVPNIRKHYIPVRYTGGTLPAYGDEVRAKGTFFLDKGGYLFLAEEVKTISKSKL